MQTTAGKPRIAPLEPPYSAETAEALARWMPPDSAIEPLRLFRTLMVHEQLASRMRPLGAGILGSSATVPPLLREVVIHRTCALTGATYEWGVHVRAFGEPLGLSAEQIRSTVDGAPEDACWDGEQACAMRLADELHTTSTLSDGLWELLASRFSDVQIIELVVTAGWYHVIGFLCNATRVEAEPWAAEPPANGVPASAPAD